jgi:hypothetical protein
MLNDLTFEKFSLMFFTFASDEKNSPAFHSQIIPR